MSQVKKNFLYNSLYQVFTIIVPIILAPFLSRRLGVSGNGVYSYTYSIVYYFTLFALLGMSNYGSRKIAKVRDSKKELSSTFCTLYTIQLSLSILIIIIYSLSIKFFFKDYKNIFMIESIFLFSAALDISWFYHGLEEFKTTAIKSFIIKLFNLFSIILFVKTPDDVPIYTLIMAISSLLNQVVLWPYVREKIYYVKPNARTIKTHIKPLLILFIPVVAVSLYKIMDKIMLGILSNINEVGFYGYAEKINSIPLTIISALGIVMMPKISNLAAKNKKREIEDYLEKSVEFALIISIPIIFIFAMSMNLVIPLYLGADFAQTSSLVTLLSITLPFVSFANVIRTQYLIPMEKDRIYVISVIIGAVLNLLFNLAFIPYLGATGACLGTIIAEMSVMIYQTIKVRNEIEIKEYIKKAIKYITISIIAFLPFTALDIMEFDPIYKTIIGVLAFGLIYCIFNRNYIFNNVVVLLNRRKNEKSNTAS